MPQNVRNFWIEAEVDGRATPLTGGPSSETGGLQIEIKQRENGSIISAATIHGYAMKTAEGDIRLSLYAVDSNGRHVDLAETIR